MSVLNRKSREQLGALADEFEQSGIRLVLGDGYLDGLTGYDAVFRAPGMYFHHPALEKARQEGAVITSEMELFSACVPVRRMQLPGPTAQNHDHNAHCGNAQSIGKKKVYKGGNIGRALLPVVEEVSSDDAAVVELSSFQLISMRQSPDVAVITNVAPNHLDVHRDMQEYIDSKKNLILHQDGFSARC